MLVTVRGGAYGAGTPREGWDHATGWMRRILADVWQLDLRVVESEFTLVGVNPALDQFRDLADQMRVRAEEQAREHGRALGAAAPGLLPEPGLSAGRPADRELLQRVAEGVDCRLDEVVADDPHRLGFRARDQRPGDLGRMNGLVEADLLGLRVEH